MIDKDDLISRERDRLIVERYHQLTIEALAPITMEDLSMAATEFEKVEKRGGFYDMSRALLASGWELEGCILLLATWNIARFRHVASNFEINELRNSLGDLSGDFIILQEYNIQNIDLMAHGPRLEAMFNRLAKIKGVEFTGASKLLHLKLPTLFVPWDDYIRGGKDEKVYSGLQCVLSRKWCFLPYQRDGQGYAQFLSDVQNRVCDLQYPEGDKTLAKNIDEWHYRTSLCQFGCWRSRNARTSRGKMRSGNLATKKPLKCPCRYSNHSAAKLPSRLFPAFTH